MDEVGRLDRDSFDWTGDLKMQHFILDMSRVPGIVAWCLEHSTKIPSIGISFSADRVGTRQVRLVSGGVGVGDSK